MARGMARLKKGGAAKGLERRVGEQLQAVRRQRGLSLRDLAEASGLSLTTVHQIEMGRTSAGLGTLQSLAAALDVSLGVLFDGQGPPAPAVYVAASEIRGITIPGGRIERLAAGLASQRLRGLVLTLGPRRETGPAPIVHPGQELVLGLEGSCAYEVAAHRYPIERGDSLLFDSSQPHRALNQGPRAARILLVLYAPEEEPRWIEPHLASGRGVAGRRGRGRDAPRGRRGR
jgi:transcriptional regulator with XRE-family HTH domain